MDARVDRVAQTTFESVSALAEKENILNNIRKNIEGLDLSSPSFKQQIEAIRSDLQRLKTLSLISDEDLASIEEGLKMMRDPLSLKASQDEGRVVALLSQQHAIPASALHDYGASDRALMREGQQQMVDAFKKNAATLEGLAASARVASSGLRERTMQTRFGEFLSQYPLPLDEKVVHYFPQIVDAFVDYQATIIKEVEEAWKGVFAAYDAQSDGKFSQLLKLYPYMNPLSTCVERAQKTFVDYFCWQELGDVLGPGGFPEYLESMVENAHQSSRLQLFPIHSQFPFAQLFWLAENAHHILTPYNQGEMKDENLGAGVCFGNCLQRLRQLQENPELPDEAIQIGSTQKSRFAQSITTQYYLLLKEKKVSQEEVMKHVIQRSDVFGLKLEHDYAQPFQPPETRYQSLVDQIDAYSEGGETQFLVSLTSSSFQSAHAVTIQMDPTRKIYRLMDDNMGLIGGYATKEEFKKQVSSYFQLFYSYSDYFFCRTFKIVPKKSEP